jgi:hypothetical protein
MGNKIKHGVHRAQKWWKKHSGLREGVRKAWRGVHWAARKASGFGVPFADKVSDFMGNAEDLGRKARGITKRHKRWIGKRPRGVQELLSHTRRLVRNKDYLRHTPNVRNHRTDTGLHPGTVRKRPREMIGLPYQPPTEEVKRRNIGAGQNPRVYY